MNATSPASQCWCGHPLRVCKPKQVCHGVHCRSLCNEYPLLSERDCICNGNVCNSGRYVLCKEKECLRIQGPCNDDSDEECACDNQIDSTYVECTSHQGCQNKTCIDKCPASPFLATADCFCHGNLCNSTQVCHNRKCVNVIQACDPTDTNCVCQKNETCLDGKICRNGKCAVPKPACMRLPVVSQAGGCSCNHMDCQEGQTCDVKRNLCNDVAVCEDPREADDWKKLNIDIQGTTPGFTTGYRLALACHSCHTVKGSTGETIYSVECLDSGKWSADIVGCEEMACAQIKVDEESVDIIGEIYSGSRHASVHQ